MSPPHRDTCLSLVGPVVYAPHEGQGPLPAVGLISQDGTLW